MKHEAPILFKAELVREIWTGHKTQTRRVERKQPAPDATFEGFDGAGKALFSDGTIWPARYGCPTSFAPDWPGTMLWVKEAYRFGTAPNDLEGQGVALFDWGRPRAIFHPDMPLRNQTFARIFKQRSGLLMYRWAARTLLRHATQRIERLQEITEADAQAEGVKLAEGEAYYPGLYREKFFVLWDRINKKRGFAVADNPWLRAIGFNLIKAPEAHL